MNCISSMTENEIKELLSKKYLEVIASRTGYKTSRPDIDNGVDLSFTFPVAYKRRSGKKRIMDSGKYLDFQLKATTEQSIVYLDEYFSYDLEAKNYDDLIQRCGGITPLILVIFILPADVSKWLNVDSEQLVMRKHAFWFYPTSALQMTLNSSTVRIKVPYENIIDINFFTNLFRHFYS